MKKLIISEKAPAAVGPYVHAVEAGGFVYVSGQLGLDPATGELKKDLAAQVRQSLDNLGAVLESAGLGYKDVVKTTVFLQNIGDFAEMNDIYAEYFNEGKPARSCVEIAALPKGGLVEVECIACK